MRVCIATLTAIQMVHIIFSGSFSNEIFHLMKFLASVMVYVLVQSKGAREVYLEPNIHGTLETRGVLGARILEQLKLSVYI